LRSYTQHHMRRLFFTTALLSVALAPTLLAYPFSFKFGHVGNAGVQFDKTDIGVNPGSFAFVNSTTDPIVGQDVGYQFSIQSMSGGWPFGEVTTGDLIGLRGRFVGTNTISPITITAGSQSAAVTGTGTLELWDTSGADVLVMTASTSWSSIKTEGTAGNLNLGGNFNLSGFTCVACGGRPNLVFLASSTNGVVSASFDLPDPQFSTMETLTTLTSGSGLSGIYSFSGRATVPEPGFYGLLALGMSGLGWIATRRRQKQTVA